MAISICLSVIILNVNRLNVPIKRHRVADQLKGKDLSICFLQEIHFRVTQRGTAKKGKRYFIQSEMTRKCV